MSRSQARTLLRNTISKRRFILDEAVAASAKAALEGAKANKDGFVLTIRSSYLAEGMNLELDRRNEGNAPLTPLRNSLSRYQATPSTYEVFCKTYKAAPVAAKPADG